MENDIKKKKGSSPKGLKPKRTIKIRALKPMKEEKKKRGLDQKMEEESA